MTRIRAAVALGVAGMVAMLLLALAASAYRVAGRSAVVGRGVASGAGGADKADELMAAIRGEAIRADMRFLADDLLEGRGTGTRGYEIAAKYMAAQFERMGLQPAGDAGTYFQNVPFKQSRPDAEKTALVLTSGGKVEKLEFRRDFITRGDPGRAESEVEADVVFVGDGVTAAEQGYDDYQGVDAKGKIVAFLYGAPPSFETSLRAHYSSIEVKEANAAAHGAAGMLLLDDPGLEKLYGFAMQKRDLAFPQLNWLDAAGKPNDYFPQLKGWAYLNMEVTKKFFASAGHKAEDVYAAAKAAKTQSLRRE